MKTFSSCIICIVCISSIALGQVTDDFSDGNFTRNPKWTGDTTHFEINSSRQLHLYSSGSDTSILFTRNSRILNTEWSFLIKLSFNTSSNNHARIYLTADTGGVVLPMNGYYLQAGGSDDSICIMKQTGAAVARLFSFKSYRMAHSTNTIRIKITRDESGNWEGMIDTTGGSRYFSEGTFFDDSFSATRWFGLMCRYTSSNATKFYFDDFYVGRIVHDSLPPEILSVEAATPSVLQIGFSEPVQKQGAENPGNYLLLTHGVKPDSSRQDVLRPDFVSLFLPEPLPEEVKDSMLVRDVVDLSGNRLKDTIVPVCFHQPKPYDILISEIMANPDPPVALPSREYVELYNRSAFPVNLQDWTFKYGSYSKVFPRMIIPAQGYLLIVKDSAYLNVAKCAMLFTSSTSLSNEGTTLVLKDPLHHVIHAVSYQPDWYRGSFKEEGGWSIEMMDSSNPCGCSENWGPSTDGSGGTPGRENSIRKATPDLCEPKALRAVISDSALLEVTFSEMMDSTSLLSPAGWTIHPAVGDPDGVAHPVRVAPVQPGFISANLIFNNSFENGVTYTLNISGKRQDCAGNSCDTSRSIRFALPQQVDKQDVVINELLSNPATGGARFVELYNRSEKVIDLQTMVIANRDTASGILPNAMPLTAGGYLLFPGDYIALTSNTQDLNERYHPGNPEAIAWMDGFPVLGDDTGTVIIARKDNQAIIDRMQYDPEMHYPLLVTAEGVSLERTNPELPSSDHNNWHSAAETAGFATPGYRNSHWIEPDDTDEEAKVCPQIFSPDNDGRDDLLMVSISRYAADCSVNIVVYDSRGRLIRQLANNVLIGSEGVFYWDGTTMARNKAPMGYYILLIELTRPDGTVKKIRKTAVLGGKLY